MKGLERGRGEELRMKVRVSNERVEQVRNYEIRPSGVMVYLND
jgi:hypothetical protein